MAKDKERDKTSSETTDDERSETRPRANDERGSESRTLDPRTMPASSRPPRDHGAGFLGHTVRYYDRASKDRVEAHVAIIIRVYPSDSGEVDLHVFFSDKEPARVKQVRRSDGPEPGHWRPLP